MGGSIHRRRRRSACDLTYVICEICDPNCGGSSSALSKPVAAAWDYPASRCSLGYPASHLGGVRARRNVRPATVVDSELDRIVVAREAVADLLEGGRPEGPELLEVPGAPHGLQREALPEQEVTEDLRREVNNFE